jgi:hypothetical protein
MVFYCPMCNAAGRFESDFVPYVTMMTLACAGSEHDTNSYQIQLRCKHGHVYEGEVKGFSQSTGMKANRDRTEREINKAIMGNDIFDPNFPDWPPGS